MKLGEKIRRLRSGRAYAEVARAGGCSSPTIREIESGRTAEPGVAIVWRLARYFGVSLDWLADDSAEWPPPGSDEQRAVDIVRSALAGAGLAGELSEDERELLAAYRLLADPDRREALGYVRGLSRAPGHEVSEAEAYEAEQFRRDGQRRLEQADRGANRRAAPPGQAEGGKAV